MTNSPIIILVEPQLSENVGMVARAMMNCGLYNLRIINPRENHLSDKAISSSSGAEEILEKATIFSSTKEAIADLSQVFATTARHRDMIKHVYTAEKAAEIIVEKASSEIKYGILFGRERTGLENDDVSLANAIIEIPLNPKHCSLNLSQAVLIVGYEWYKHQGQFTNSKLVTNKTEIANHQKVDTFLEFLEQKLQDFPHLQNEEKKPRMIRNLHNIFSRSEITEQELNTLYGIFNHLTKY